MKMTSKTIGRLGLAACVALVAGVAAVVIDSPSQKESPEQALLSVAPLTERLYHPTEGQPQPKDLVNSIVLSKDGHETSYDTYADKTSADIHLWNDDLHKVGSEDYYPFGEDGRRQLRSQATFNPAGAPGDELFTSHAVYRDGSGTLEREGKLQRDGRYRQTYMMDDGETVWRDRWFDSMRNFVQESVYKWNAAHTETYAFEKIIKGDFVGKFYVSFYREDGSRSATLTLVSEQVTEGALFGPDGSTLLAEFGDEGGVLGHSYYLFYENGSKTPTKEWESTSGRMTVLVAAPDSSRVILRQVWKERPDLTVPGGKRYLLVRADHLDTSNDQIVRVNMTSNGAHPKEIVIPSKDGDTVKELDETGKKVVKVEKQDASGTALSSLLAPKSATEELVEIDPSILIMPQRPEVPSYNDANAPPRIYDYK